MAPICHLMIGGVDPFRILGNSIGWFDGVPAASAVPLIGVGFRSTWLAARRWDLTLGNLGLASDVVQASAGVGLLFLQVTSSRTPV